jgi:hypothetical protein|nr:MAG TPA: hypothetical protein [Caudoviricetes sp.]
MGIVVFNKKKALKNLWEDTKKSKVTNEILDTFLIEMFVMYSYDHKEEPPFLLGRDLQKALNLPFAVKYRQVNRVLGGLK